MNTIFGKRDRSITIKSATRDIRDLGYSYEKARGPFSPSKGRDRHITLPIRAVNPGDNFFFFKVIIKD